ncbi:MAG: NAD(P)-dependent oxidoreductase [Ferruginibacter sp.]
MSFKNKTFLITGATRGIGKAMALKFAKDGANIVVAAKSTEENPKLGGTIFSAAAEIEAAGGKALAVKCDIRNEDEINETVKLAVEKFGGIDFLINNASAISLTPVEQTEAKRFDLMHDVNVRGTFLMCKACIPHLKKSTCAHILTLSPPLNMNMKWFSNHLAYTISKYNMTMIALGLAEELKKFSVASNALWPQTTIATAAVQNLLGGDALMKMSRTPEIIADAAYFIFSQPASYTGKTLIDEEVLADSGVTDLEKYSVTPGGKLFKDLFLD